MQNATIEYSSEYSNSKSNQSMNMKFEYFEVYENILHKFDIEYCLTKVKAHSVTLIFSPFTAIETIRSLNTTLAQARKLILSIRRVCLSDNNIQLL